MAFNINKMRNLSCVLIITFLISCNHNKSSDRVPDSFNESKYILKKTDLNNNDEKVSETYFNRDNPSQKLVKLFLPNKRLVLITYYTGTKKNGPTLAFDSSGSMLFNGFYLEDKKNGVWCYYTKENEIYNFEIYDNGKKTSDINSIKESIVK
jgi:antitoxin component YwqK of YwqJK toxin-antitoxin module